jgi:hypothetical protein
MGDIRSVAGDLAAKVAAEAATVELAAFGLAGDAEQGDQQVHILAMSLADANRRLYQVAGKIAGSLLPGLERISRDGDWLRCLCQNTPDQAGFGPCLPDGTEVEPVDGGGWDGVLYLCYDCGRIVDQFTLEVTARRADMPPQRIGDGDRPDARAPEIRDAG